MNSYLHQAEEKQKTNLCSSFHSRSMFHFGNTTIFTVRDTKIEMLSRVYAYVCQFSSEKKEKKRTPDVSVDFGRQNGVPPHGYKGARNVSANN